jgi:hypothetical protein
MKTKHPFVQIAGVCSFLAPLTMFFADSLLTATAMMFEWSIILWLAFVFFVPAIFGLAFVLYENGNRRIALAGGASAFFGAMAGASMQVLFRVYAVLNEHGAAQSVELLRGTFKLIAATQMIGIFFPAGLILLAIGIFRSRIFNPAIAFLLASGAVLFPVGRIGGFTFAILGSGVLLLAAFGLIGLQILRRKNESIQSAEIQLAEAN